jgi:hypothetical protein
MAGRRPRPPAAAPIAPRPPRIFWIELDDDSNTFEVNGIICRRPRLRWALAAGPIPPEQLAFIIFCAIDPTGGDSWASLRQVALVNSSFLRHCRLIIEDPFPPVSSYRGSRGDSDDGW